MTRAAWFWRVFIILYFSKNTFGDEKTLYMATERPVITYLHPKYILYANMTSQRYGRSSPIYYVNLHITTLVAIDNRFIISFWFYEYYSSHYRRSFLEVTTGWCNLVYKDQFFGPALRKNLPPSCPHKPGTYHMRNMTASVKAIPNFPFSKGRIYSNMTLKRDLVFSAYIDIEMKHLRRG